MPYATLDARRRGVLAFTCAVHLLALFLWTQERRLLPVRPPRVVTILLQSERARAVRPPVESTLHLLPAPSLPAIPSLPTRVTQPVPAHLRDVASEAQRDARTEAHTDAHADATRVPASSAPDPAAPTATASTPSAVDIAQPAAPAADARPDTAAPALPAATQGSFALGLAKHQAGRIDRELRKGKPGVPTEADTPSARFERGLAAAHIDRSLTLQSDTYTSPDGVVIYRFRQGNRVRCRRAGSVGIPLRGMPEGADTMATVGSAASTDCPKGVVWNRDD
jgi:hypothetical protein